MNINLTEMDFLLISCEIKAVRSEVTSRSSSNLGHSTNKKSPLLNLYRFRINDSRLAGVLKVVVSTPSKITGINLILKNAGIDYKFKNSLNDYDFLNTF